MLKRTICTALLLVLPASTFAAEAWTLKWDRNTETLRPATISELLDEAQNENATRRPGTRTERMRRGAKRGAIIGAVLGAISLAVQHEEVGGGSSVGEAAGLGAFSGALFGGLIGGLIGAVRAGDASPPGAVATSSRRE